MQLKDFINKVVISTATNKRMYLCEITSPYFKTVSVDADEYGHTWHVWPTINGNAFENGRLVFEDSSLTAPFLSVYNDYCRTKDAYWEEYGYWMRRD